MTSIRLGQEWSISAKGLDIISENNTLTNKNAVFQNALNSDLKEIGQPILAKELTKARITELVLQIQKIRNVSAPKANEDSQAAPRLLKLTLTDGESYVQAVESSQIPSISREKTPPGSKLLIKDVEIVNGFLILNQENTKLLGGKVKHLFEKWELAKSIQHCSRSQATLDGPPAWVNFGHKINHLKEDIPLPSSKSKEQNKESSEFEAQRQEAIAEASTGAIKKVFGGGVKQPIQNNYRNDNNNRGRNDGGKNFGKGKREPKSIKEKEIDDRPQKISDKVSLFDFLEDKLNIPDSIDSVKPKDESYRKFPDRDNRRNFDNNKGYNTYKNPNYYESNYENSKPKFNKDPTLKKRDTNRNNEQFSSSYSRYDSGRESFNKNPPLHSKKDNNFHSNKFENQTFDTSLSNRNNESYASKQNQHYRKPQEGSSSNKFDNQTIDTLAPNRNNESYASKQNQHYRKPQEGSSLNKFDNTIDTSASNKNNDSYASKQNQHYRKAQEASSSNKSHESVQNHSQMNGSRENSFKRTEKERITDSWHYRAPEKGGKTSQNPQVDNLVESMGKVSMNHEFASRSLRSHLNLDTKKPPQNVQSQSSEAKTWAVGEGCLAKYWEDGKFYPAKITGFTEATYVVQFEGYGNIEEVLKMDCKSLGVQQEKNHYKGSMEFRRSPRKFAAS